MRECKYEVVSSEDDIAEFQAYILDNKIKGYFFPYRPEGDVWHITIDEGTATMLSLKFKLKSICQLGAAEKVFCLNI